jgi:SagB-type dehydrogenase family enzyme
VTLVLSRYACLRAEHGRILAEGVGARTPAPLEDPASLALVTSMMESRTLPEAAKATGIEMDEAERLARPLIAAGVLVDEHQNAAEEESVWTFHDRLMHARTRPADRSQWYPPGPPPPALPQRDWQQAVALEAPDMDAIERDDPPLARVQAARKSKRVHGPPLTASRLGEFLFRVGRVHDVWQIFGETYASRPYPSAGALYELEFYVAVGACSGVDPGLYHYAGDHHRLERIPAPEGVVARLLSDAAAAMAVPTTRPHVLIVLAVRFPRLATKYGPLAYTLVLKNVGVVMQMMYLSATAMGLAGCAVGAGDSVLFARATGLPIEEETSVGEFCVGEPAPD